jgi:MerR family transcriptional regulator, light-induced transcriptional regulator
MSVPEALRIGEFSRRVGVSAEVLRAWERRYGLLNPLRSPGGFRLYTSADAARVERMQDAIAGGLSAAQAAQAAIGGEAAPGDLAGPFAARLLGAAREYDEEGVQGALDDGFQVLGLETMLREVVLPTLATVGMDWETDPRAISREHFASNLIRARLLTLARLWGRGSGPLALLACPSGERHDIGLIAFGLVLRSYGWRIVFLGADVPVPTLTETVRDTRSELTVLASFDAELLERQAAALRILARSAKLLVAGPGATEQVCSRLGVARLDGEITAVASELGRSGARAVGSAAG